MTDTITTAQLPKDKKFYIFADLAEAERVANGRKVWHVKHETLGYVEYFVEAE